MDEELPPINPEELKRSGDEDFLILCDAKYLKRNAKGETPLHTAARKVSSQTFVYDVLLSLKILKYWSWIHFVETVGSCQNNVEE